MFAAKQGFYTTNTSLTPAGNPYWVCVFDDFIPDGIDIADIGSSQISLLAGTTSTGGNKGCLVKLDNNGNVLFQQQSTGAVNSLTGVKTDGNQFAHVIGSTNENGTTRPYTAVMDNTGTLIWEKYISDVTSGTFNGITYQENSTLGYHNIIVGRSNSTSSSQFMAFRQSDGTLTDQQKYGTTEILYDVAKDPATPSGSTFNVGLETTSGTDDVVLVSMDNTYSVVNQKLISDTVNLQRPSINWPDGTSNLLVSTTPQSGTYVDQPYLISFDPSNFIPYSTSVFAGTVTSDGLKISKAANPSDGSSYVLTGTQTDNTIWLGTTGPAHLAIFSQINFYFGTPGTHTTSVNGITNINEAASAFAGIYIIGQTDYYGGTKGFVARLPADFSITGTFGASSEIHIDSTGYMSPATSVTLTITTPSVSPSNTGFTNTTSALTQTAGTDTTTLTVIP